MVMTQNLQLLYEKIIDIFDLAKSYLNEGKELYDNWFSILIDRSGRAESKILIGNNYINLVVFKKKVDVSFNFAANDIDYAIKVYGVNNELERHEKVKEAFNYLIENKLDILNSINDYLNSKNLCIYENQELGA